VLTNPLAAAAPPLSRAFAKEVVDAGGAVVYSHDLFPLAESFAPLLRDAYTAGAQAIYMTAGVGAVAACGIRQDMKGIFPASAYVLSDDRLADDGCIAHAGLAGTSDDHLVLTIATGQPAAVPVALQGMRRSNGYPIYTFAGYDSARILVDAIDRAIRANDGKIPTREEVREAVATTKGFKGITGTYSFDANGDVVNPSFSFYTVKQGSWAFWRNP
jgi:branched-chain amino acid transport system substrate-binding protein